MTRIGDALANSIAGQERRYSKEGAAANPVTKARIRRRRGGIAVGTVTAILAGVGLAASLGLALANKEGPADEPDRPITVQFLPSNLSQAYAGSFGAMWYCGEPAPTPAPITGDFTLAWAVDSLGDDLTDLAPGGVYSPHPNVLTLSGRHAGAGFVSVAYLFVRDGVVVGFSEGGTVSPTGPSGVPEWGASGTLTIDAVTDGAAACGTFDYSLQEQPQGNLPSGNYKVYPVVRIESTAETDALRALAALGISSETTAFDLGPGSWDCRNEAALKGLTPVGCVEQFATGERVELATITIPPELQVPRVRETLVGAPIPYTRVGTFPGQNAEPTAVEPDFPVCEPIDPPEGRWSFVNSLDIYADLAEIEAGAGHTIDGYVLADPMSDGSIAFPDGLEFVVFRWSDPTLQSWPVARGRMTVDGSHPITLDRFSGPTPVTLTVDSLDWCGGIPGPDSTLWVRFTGYSTWTGSVEVPNPNGPTGGFVRDPSEIAVLP